MKIYTKVVISMETMETLEEESYEYKGEIAHCGGGGSSGGGGSGKVDYPQYIKDVHQALLGGSDISLDTPTDTAINDAMAADPYAYLAGFDPSPHTAEMAHAIDDLDVFINSMESTNEIEAQLAKFDAGMRDLNAVVSSAYAVGREVIASTLMSSKLQAKMELAKLSVEARRIMIVVNKEFTQYENELEVEQAKWPLDMLQHGGNMLAAISGAATTKSAGEGPSKAQSAVGGALSGAASGAMVGSAVPGVGTAVGAVAGGVMGAAGGLL